MGGFKSRRRREKIGGKKKKKERNKKPGISVIYFGMTITRAENFCLPQRSTELITSAETTSHGLNSPVYVGVQIVSSRIETEAELDS